MAVFEVNAECKRDSQFLPKKRSAKKHTIPASADSTNGVTRIFCFAASIKRKDTRYKKARVNPQAGQGIPDILLKIQKIGTEKPIISAIPKIAPKKTTKYRCEHIALKDVTYDIKFYEIASTIANPF